MDSEDLLTCSLCLGDFEDPRALPCLHTFCLSCLVQLYQSNCRGSNVRCPICQEDHPLPAKGVFGFRQDFRMKNLLEMSKPIMRSLEPCVKAVMCKWHPKVEVTLFCQEAGCDRAVLCDQCVEQSHQTHPTHPIKEICETKLDDIKVIRKAIRQNNDMLEIAKAKVNGSKLKVSNEIKSRVRELHAVLDRLEKELQDAIDVKAEEQQMSILDEEKKLKNVEDQVTSLETVLSNTIPHIVQTNAEKYFDTDLNKLVETMEKWNLKYSVLDLDVNRLTESVAFSTNITSVLSIKEDTALGAPVVLSSKTFASPPIRAKKVSDWLHGNGTIRGLTCHNIGGLGLTIASSAFIGRYKQNEGQMFESYWHNDHICQVTTFNEHCHAVIDRRGNQIRLHYDWPLLQDKLNYAIPVMGQAGLSISGTRNYLFFSSQVGPQPQTLIDCLSVVSYPPRRMWQWKVPIGSQTPYALSALETLGRVIVLVSTYFPDVKPPPDSTALVAMMNTNGQYWRLTFNELDSTTNYFDLLDIANDGQYFYLLNGQIRCVYVISTDGKVLSKILENLNNPTRLAVNMESKHLVVACNDTKIEVYKLVY